MNRQRAGDPRRDAAWLSAALREQAGEHEADLSRIEKRFARVVTGEPGHAGRRSGRPEGPERAGRPERARHVRLIGVPLGVLAAGVTATIATGVTLGIGARPAHPVTKAVASASPDDPADTRSPSQAAILPAGTASSRSEASPEPSPRPGPLAANSSVDAHSTQYWAQENLTLTVRGAIKALHVTVIVSGGSAVRSTGSWSTILSQYLDVRVEQNATGLVYDVALKPGQTLQPGSYAFGFQFDRPAAGHSFGLDRYTVTATTAQGAGQASSAAGDFAH